MSLVALFSPEHGIRGIEDEENVASEKDARTGLTIHSLYGATRRPTDDMLKGLDTLVVDLADVGARFYTYHATIGYVMEEAAKRKIDGRRPRSPEPDQRLADRRAAARRAGAGVHGRVSRRCQSGTA